VLATDIDPSAVRAARANSRLNRAGTTIEVVEAEGVSAGKIRGHAPFALVFANILLGPLQRLAAPLRFRDKATWRVVAKDAAALGADPAEVSIALRMALSLEGVEYRPK
jgi:ribosomal protein L11 methylase PrmA